MDAQYTVHTSHFCLTLNVFMVMFTLSEALCPGLGQLENGMTFFRYGGIYTTFTCNPGFRLLGHVSNSCIGGKWRKPVPVCVASGCNMPAGILHGSHRTSHNNAVITFICNKGYKLFGSSFIYCNGKKWNSTMPVCRESDMMSSSLRKTIPEMSSSVFMRNPSLSSKSSDDLHMNLYNTAQNEPHAHHSNIISRSNSTTIIRIEDIQDKKRSYQHKELLKFWENQRQLHVTPGDKLKTTNTSSPGERYTSVFSSIQETHTEPPKISIINLYSLSSKVQTQRQTIKWTESTTPKTVTIPFPTTLNNYTLGPLVPNDHYPKAENDVTSRNAFISLFHGHLPHLRTTSSKVKGTTKWTQSEDVFTGTDNSHQSHSVRNQSPILHLLSTYTGSVIPEATSSKSSILDLVKSTYGPPKYITASANVNYIIDHSEYANTEQKPIATLPSLILASITASVINSTQMLPASFHQVTQGSISQTDDATNDKQYKYSKLVYDVTAKQSTHRYKTTAMQSLHLARKPSVTIHETGEMDVTTPRITSPTHFPHTTKASRAQIRHGTLMNALKRRMWCFYPPVPIHGTFRFLTLKDPLPNQYQYYIQYYCYPGYTMALGDVYSFCMENGTWSGLTPICKDM